MAFGTSSKIFRAFLADTLAQDVAHDLNAATMKIALFNNSVTPDQDAARAATGYNGGTWLVANEVTSTGQWDAAGRLLTNPTVSTPAAGTVMFDADDASSGAAATLANVYGALVYSDAPANDPGICYLAFGGAQSVTNGTFTAVFSSNGIMRFSVV